MTQDKDTSRDIVQNRGRLGLGAGLFRDVRAGAKDEVWSRLLQRSTVCTGDGTETGLLPRGLCYINVWND